MTVAKNRRNKGGNTRTTAPKGENSFAILASSTRLLEGGFTTYSDDMHGESAECVNDFTFYFCYITGIAQFALLG